MAIAIKPKKIKKSWRVSYCSPWKTLSNGHLVFNIQIFPCEAIVNQRWKGWNIPNAKTTICRRSEKCTFIKMRHIEYFQTTKSGFLHASGGLVLLLTIGTLKSGPTVRYHTCESLVSIIWRTEILGGLQSNEMEKENSKYETLIIPSSTSCCVHCTKTCSRQYWL